MAQAISPRYQGVWAPSATFTEIHDNAQIHANGYLPEITTNNGTNFRLVAPPYQFDNVYGQPTSYQVYYGWPLGW